MPPLGIVASKYAANNVITIKIETVMLTKILRLRGCGSAAAENRRAAPMARKMYEENVSRRKCLLSIAECWKDAKIMSIKSESNAQGLNVVTLESESCKQISPILLIP